MHVARSLAATVAVLATCISLPTAAVAAAGGNGAGGSTKVTICHATGSTTNPFVTITVDQSALNGHSGHAGDIVPAPTTGCPTGTSPGSGSSGTGTSTDTGSSSGTGSGTGGTTGTSPGSGATGSPQPTGPTGKVTICHATGSLTNPYVTITIAQAGLSGHAGHPEDLVPAPVEGCPGAGVQPLLPGCSDRTPALAFASGVHAVTLRTCGGVSLRMWGDPWITFTAPGTAPAPPFPIGFGSWSMTVPGGATISWGTDPLARNALAWMKIDTAAGSATIVPLRYPQATPAGRAARVQLTGMQVRAFRDALLACTGDTQQPIVCRPQPAGQPATSARSAKL